MDGNGRWATKRGLPRDAGHVEGLKALKRIVEAAAADPTVRFASFYVFSTENWKRPEAEVKYLMKLLETRFSAEIPFFIKNNIRVLVKGRREDLPAGAVCAIEKTEKETAAMTGLTCVFCINYGGQDEIVRAVNRFVSSNPGEKITAENLEANLDRPSVPPVDIVARSAGEMRLSNFLLWECAYAEFVSIEDYWPDWGEEQYKRVKEAYSKRVRNFGGLV